MTPHHVLLDDLSRRAVRDIVARYRGVAGHLDAQRAARLAAAIGRALEAVEQADRAADAAQDAVARHAMRDARLALDELA